MALNANTYYSNSIQGIPGAGVDVNVETVDSAPRYPAGYLVERADGSRFRYCHVGTATNSGLLVGPTTASAGATYGAGVVVASTLATAVPQEYPILPGQVGSHYIQFTIASIAANKYQGGYIITTGGTGVGDSIVGNTATGTPNSTDLYIQLAEALTVAVTAATGTIIVGSMFTDLAATATSASQVTGVLMATTTSTNLWAWVCTHGIIGCTEDATSSTPVAGVPVMASLNLAGAYQAVSTATATALLTGVFSQPIVGYCRTVAGGTKNRQGVIFLTLE